MGGAVDLLTGGSSGASASIQKAVNAIEGVQLPEIEQMKLDLQQLVLQGELSPEDADAILVEASKMEDIQVDPQLKQKQMNALAALEEIAAEGGMNAQDRAKLEQLKTDLSAQERGQREAIMQGAQQRGVGGSGLDLAQQMINQQASAGRASQQGLDIKAQAEQRALEAIMQGGQLSGDIRGQEFGEQARIAEAQDAISRFNVGNQQNVELTNVGARNEAAEKNLAEQQRIADTNVGTSNVQQQYNKELEQQQFQNEMTKAGAVADAYIGKAASQDEEAKRKSDAVGNIISGGATVLAGKAASDINVKENIDEFDSSEFLNELTGYKYNYKRPKQHGEGDQVGIMAQDLEKVAPQAVSKDSEGTKVIDYNKLGGPILAALADIDERLKEGGM